MSRAIPARLLTHECTLRKRTGQDRNRNPTCTETVLKRVRIGATFQTVRGNVGETKADTLTLIIDAANTYSETTEGEPAITEIPEELDGVEWQGKEYTVRSVTPCYARDAGMPHHWEVTLE